MHLVRSWRGRFRTRVSSIVPTVLETQGACVDRCELRVVGDRDDACEAVVSLPPGFLHEPDNLALLPRRRPTLRCLPPYAEARVLVGTAVVHRCGVLPESTPDLHRPVCFRYRLHDLERMIPRVDVPASPCGEQDRRISERCGSSRAPNPRGSDALCPSSMTPCGESGRRLRRANPSARRAFEPARGPFSQPASGRSTPAQSSRRRVWIGVEC
jgi:hypothetical protein